MTKALLSTQLLQTAYVFLGALSMAFGVVCFLSPNGVITGGGIGIALILHFFITQLTLGTLIVCVSIPFIVLGYVYFGKLYFLKTLVALFATSFFTFSSLGFVSVTLGVSFLIGAVVCVAIRGDTNPFVFIQSSL